MTSALDMLARQPFLAGLPEAQLERLSHWSKRAVLHAGYRIFSEGGRADRFWLLREGRVNLDTHLPGKGDVVVETVGAGSVLGWSWMFPPYRWHFGAVTVEPTLAIEMDGPGVRRVCADDPALGYELTMRFMQVVVDRLQATRVRMLDLHRAPAP
jgi:CRP/FNR family transcriptional regulator, cyclic AMP receptor protein